MSKTVKLRWAQKLARARYFVILTDKESVIALDGVDPESFEDIMALQSQMAAIEDFSDRLQDLMKRHEKAVAKLAKGESAKKKVIKIKVKEG